MLKKVQIWQLFGEKKGADLTKKGADLTTFWATQKGADWTKKGADLTMSLYNGSLNCLVFLQGIVFKIIFNLPWLALLSKLCCWPSWSKEFCDVQKVYSFINPQTNFSLKNIFQMKNSTCIGFIRKTIVSLQWTIQNY